MDKASREKCANDYPESLEGGVCMQVCTALAEEQKLDLCRLWLHELALLLENHEFDRVIKLIIKKSSNTHENTQFESSVATSVPLAQLGAFD
jgi:hypothetical protein